MRIDRNNMKFALALILAAIVLQACASSQIRVGFVGGQSGSQMEYTFTRFDGLEKKSLPLSQGEVLIVDYIIELEGGSITIQLVNPDQRVVWQETFSEDAASEAEILLELDGIYQLSVIGENARGGFHLAWTTD